MACWRVGVGVGVVSVLLGGCTSQGFLRLGSAQYRNADGGSVIYVDNNEDGNQDYPSRVYQTVEQGVYAACDLPAPRTVLVGAGEYGGATDHKKADRDEKNIFVRCPMTIRGATKLTFDAAGVPTGYEDQDAANGGEDNEPADDETGPTRIRVLTNDVGDTIFRVVSSDVTIEGFVLDGGSSGNGLAYVVDIGGFPQADDPDAECPSDVVSNVEVRDSVLTGTGAAVESYNASNVRLTRLYEDNNITGFLLLGGPEESNASEQVSFTRSTASWLGGCVFSTSIAYAPMCGPDQNDTRSLANNVVISDSDFNNNFLVGLRQTALAVGYPQPDVSGTLDLWVTDSHMNDNGWYGIVNDDALRQLNSDGSITQITSPATQHAVYLNDQYENNGYQRPPGSAPPSDVLIGFQVYPNTVRSRGPSYASGGTLALDFTPAIEDLSRVDTDIPPLEYGDTAYLNGQDLSSPPPTP